MYSERCFLGRFSKNLKKNKKKREDVIRDISGNSRVLSLKRTSKNLSSRTIRIIFNKLDEPRLLFLLLLNGFFLLILPREILQLNYNRWKDTISCVSNDPFAWQLMKRCSILIFLFSQETFSISLIDSQSSKSYHFPLKDPPKSWPVQIQSFFSPNNHDRSNRRFTSPPIPFPTFPRNPQPDQVVSTMEGAAITQPTILTARNMLPRSFVS